MPRGQIKKNPRMTSSSRRLVASMAALSLLSLFVNAAFNVDMKFSSSQVSLTAEALELTVIVTPKQPKLKQLALETLVDSSGATVLSGLTFRGDGSKFVTKLSGDKKLKAGMYKLKVSAVDENTKKKTSEVLKLKVTTPVEVASAKVNGKKLMPGDKLTGQNFKTPVEEALMMEVKLQQAHDKTPVVAHQAILRFTHNTKNVDTYFALVADATQTHSVSLPFAALSENFGFNSGKHHVELILGASTFEQAIVWDLGEVELQLLAPPPETPSPLYKKPLLHESDTTLKSLPEITHVMREQDPRPPVFFSIAFMAAALVPLVFFVVLLKRLQLNVKRLFEDAVFIFGSMFLATLGGIFALFGLYWLKLTMFHTLGYLSVLGSVNFWFGHLTLKRLAQNPAKKTTKVE
ncbi:hypothetical protein PsorP6_008530 [Peronosclerospora sorghi]|uniref:Uncharacterized protein n=1 Tax=Peronosclerospora sorghi TaxID=230839 RepID=A0ACC0W9A4_9STRA|nr:hypothetical protein PsorP6_008530 [Peronosclerospora sorghi]